MGDALEALVPLKQLANDTSIGQISFHEIIDPVAKRFVAKIHAIYHSSFDRVLFLDADNVPVRDPSFLFDSPEFVKTGALFWPDFWHPTSTMFGLHNKSLLWELLDVNFVDMFEQESGQLVVDRRRHAAPLELVLFYATHEPNFFVHYKLAWGDKDLFRLAWLKLNSTFHMIETPPAMAAWQDLNRKKE
uniref:Nucleotide-diphospho-sugar transferase n=1 Tax=Phytophthora ramorum TaxID=164328 RepID=H3GDI9_PHYRM